VYNNKIISDDCRIFLMNLNAMSGYCDTWREDLKRVSETFAKL